MSKKPWKLKKEPDCPYLYSVRRRVRGSGEARAFYYCQTAGNTCLELAVVTGNIHRCRRREALQLKEGGSNHVCLSAV